VDLPTPLSSSCSYLYKRPITFYHLQHGSRLWVSDQELFANKIVMLKAMLLLLYPTHSRAGLRQAASQAASNKRLPTEPTGDWRLTTHAPHFLSSVVVVVFAVRRGGAHDSRRRRLLKPESGEAPPVRHSAAPPPPPPAPAPRPRPQTQTQTGAYSPQPTKGLCLDQRPKWPPIRH
jgi:hypothetical protein